MANIVIKVSSTAIETVRYCTYNKVSDDVSRDTVCALIILPFTMNINNSNDAESTFQIFDLLAIMKK